MNRLRVSTNVLAMVTAISAWSCSGGPPGVTHSREIYFTRRVRGPAWNPDSSRFAFAVAQSRHRRAIGLNAWPDGGVSAIVHRAVLLYVYDLASRTGPRQIATLGLEDCSLAGWEREGILLTLGKKPPYRRMLMDPETGAIRGLPAAEGDRLVARFRRPQATVIPYDFRDIRRVDFLAEQAFLWQPATYTRELLFSLTPPAPGDVSGGAVEQDRTRWQASDALHRIRSLEAVFAGDSVEITLDTYVPRPGRESKEYDLICSDEFLDAPEVGEMRRDARGIGRVLLTLGPEAQRIVRRVRFGESRRLARRQDDAGRIGGLTTVWVRLVKRPESTDEQTLHPGSRQGSWMFAHVRTRGRASRHEPRR